MQVGGYDLHLYCGMGEECKAPCWTRWAYGEQETFAKAKKIALAEGWTLARDRCSLPDRDRCPYCTGKMKVKEK